MLCKTCKRAVIRVWEGEENSLDVDHGELKELILCPLDSIDTLEDLASDLGKLTACSKYLPKDKEATV